MLTDYGDFRPAHQLTHSLPKFSGNEDPRKLIGQYVALFYAVPSETLLPESSRYKVTDKSFADVILGIGQACFNAAKS